VKSGNDIVSEECKRVFKLHHASKACNPDLDTECAHPDMHALAINKIRSCIWMYVNSAASNSSSARCVKCKCIAYLNVRMSRYDLCLKQIDVCTSKYTMIHSHTVTHTLELVPLQLYLL
jgi:hypothetical protein